MTFSEYRRYDGVALGELVSRGEMRAGELLETAIERAENINPKLNGLILPLYETARARAKSMDEGKTPLDARFAGVPMLAKDLYQEIAGAPHYMGNKGLKAADNRETENSEIVERWYNAGAVIFGRTNTPEFGLKGITESEAWGPARNPWNLEHTPGGSSGGSAALTAAGVVPFAGGNDGGGSIRIPAACCGLFGLKPGRGRTPWGPQVTELMSGLVSNHGVSRSVRDSAAMLDATRGPQAGALFRIEPPPRPYLEEMGRDPGRLRIAYTSRSPIGTEVHPEADAAVRSTAELLESLGHEVVEAQPAIDGNAIAKDWLMLWFAEAASAVDVVRRKSGCGSKGFEAETVLAAAFGRSIKATEYTNALLRRQGYLRELDLFLGSHDLFLTPTLAGPPVKVGALEAGAAQKLAARLVAGSGTARLFLDSKLFESLVRDNLKHTPFTQLANLTGVPAMSVPLHWTDKGLPLGVQFLGRHGDESLLFRLASQLEQARPWFHREPGI